MTGGMLEKMARAIQRIQREAVPFDPSNLGDDLASRVDWSPVKGGGASFRTHHLERIDSNRCEFKAAAGAKLFYGVFVVMGLGVAIAFGTAGASSAGLFPVLFGLGFAAIGGVLWYFGAAPIVFDKRRGAFWKGRQSPYDVRNVSELKHHAPLDRIHALQIISEYVRGNKSSYYSYELNLVLDDGTRLNVVDHGRLDRLREDAQMLSTFLERPVWDATA